MPRPKKDGKTVSFYLDKELLDRFDRFCDDTGRSKTGAIEWMMKKTLDEVDKEKNTDLLSK